MLIPWTKIRSWDCMACGDCCKYFTINIKYEDWVKIINKHGTWAISPGVREFYIKRRPDGRCVFQHNLMGKWICELQDVKPGICKRWPFRIYRKSRRGKGEVAIFQYRNENFYVYLESFCKGIQYGYPSTKFAKQVIPEFIEIYLGNLKNQVNSTSKIFDYLLHPQIPQVKPRRIL